MNRHDVFSILLLIIIVFISISNGIEKMKMKEQINSSETSISELSIEVRELKYYQEHQNDTIVINIYQQPKINKK